MFRSFFLGKAFRIPLFVHITFFLLPLLALALNWTSSWVAVFFSQAVLLSVFGCVVLHELGHALMARVFGIRTRDITLYPIGGVARLESTGARPLEEVLIALAGPAVNLALVSLLTPLVILAAFLGIPLNPDRAFQQGPATLLLSYFVMLWGANGVLMLFNLLPVFPMDGGRVLRAVLSLGLGTLRATELAAGIALVLALLLCVAGVYLGSPTLGLVPLFVVIAGQMELGALRKHEASRRLELTLPPLEVQPIPLALPAQTPPPTLAGFTGLVWDSHHQVWVRWVDGQPVEIH